MKSSPWHSEMSEEGPRALAKGVENEVLLSRVNEIKRGEASRYEAQFEAHSDGVAENKRPMVCEGVRVATSKPTARNRTEAQFEPSRTRLGESKRIVAFWGYPEPDVIKETKKNYPDAQWVDLDVDFGYPPSKVLPEAYCKIMKNIFDNAFYLRERIIKILAPIGKDKCDSAFFASQILKENGFDVQTTIFENTENRGKTPICESGLPLRQKFELITASIVGEKLPEVEYVPPRFGFWGVPPNDLSILELFPDNTHAFGWIRAVEAGVPADLELEMHVEPSLPTVFFAQTFCAKNQLAKYLAQRHNGLYIDIDGYANNSTKAKLEAFLKLR